VPPEITTTEGEVGVEGLLFRVDILETAVYIAAEQPFINYSIALSTNNGRVKNGNGIT
jgi:hypothetical protein